MNHLEVIKKYTIGDGYEIIIDLDKSEGSWVVDKCTGKKYLDLASNYASQPLGWNHPDLDEKELGHYAKVKVANSDWYTEKYAEFVQTFADNLPDFNHLFFIDGGSLAVENALKAAFDYKYSLTKIKDPILDVVHFTYAFHGRSGYTLSLTNTDLTKIHKFPKFNWTRVCSPVLHTHKDNVRAVEDESLYHVKKACKENVVAAIIIEPIQGEGGDNHFNPRFFRGLRNIADDHDAMLIFDEVQTGYGTTGKTWAYENIGVKPDMICFGKKTQVCGFASTNKIDRYQLNVFKKSSRINSTWGGNLVDMARFCMIDKVVKRDNLIDNARDVGQYILDGLRSIKGIRNIRGMGFMIAFDCINRTKVLEKLREKVLVLACGGTSIRLRPNLNFSKQEADLAIKLIHEAL